MQQIVLKDITVKCTDIKKTYDGQTLALRGVNLEVFSSELLILAGQSGCGKTTLISIISGVLRYDSGSCYVFGNNLSDLNEKELSHFRAKTVGFVFQSFNLIPTLTVAQNVAIPLIINGSKHDIAIKKAQDLLEKVGIPEKSYEFPENLSGGQRQRVAIARSLIHDPDLIVCDEPTSALDSETGQNIMKLLKDLVQNSNKTVIVVTHDNRTFDFANRMVFMEDGKVKGNFYEM